MTGSSNEPLRATLTDNTWLNVLALDAIRETEKAKLDEKLREIAAQAQAFEAEYAHAFSETASFPESHTFFSTPQGLVIVNKRNRKDANEHDVVILTFYPFTGINNLKELSAAANNPEALQRMFQGTITVITEKGSNYEQAMANTIRHTSTLVGYSNPDQGLTYVNPGMKRPQAAYGYYPDFYSITNRYQPLYEQIVFSPNHKVNPLSHAAEVLESLRQPDTACLPVLPMTTVNIYNSVNRSLIRK